MTSYILRRLGFSVFVLWGAATIVFAALRLAPGDPAQLMLGTDATAQDVAVLRLRLGLNEPLSVQYVRFLVRAVQLDFGNSLRLDRPAVVAIAERIGATIQLAVTAMLLAVLISFPLGMAAGLQPRSVVDAIVSVLSLLGQAVPGFWLGIMFILVFARQLRLLPSGGNESWQHLILPALTVALPLVGVLTRLVRSGLREVLHEDYIRTAHAKGLAAHVVVTRHALLNMLIPIVTVLGLQVGHLLGGAVITETVFAWPGIRRLLIEAICNRDYPLVQATILFITAGFILVNFLVDLSYGYIDPRIRLR